MKARESLLHCHLAPSSISPQALPLTFSHWKLLASLRNTLSHPIGPQATFEDRTYFSHLSCNPYLMKISVGSIYICFLKSGFNTFIFSWHVICQLPSSNLQCWVQSHFGLNTCFLNFLSTYLPKPRCKAGVSPSLPTYSFPVLLRTYCYSIYLNGNLIVSIFRSAFHLFPSIDFLNGSFKIYCYYITHLLLFFPFPTEYCPSFPLNS